MKLTAGLLSVVAVAAMGFAIGLLVLGLLVPGPQPFVAPEPAAAPPRPVASARALPTGWPAVFGRVPEIAPAPVPEPEPAVIAVPTEENTTYWLTGLVAGRNNESWALISENDRGVVVRVGDVLVGGETVTAIDAQGVWIAFEGTRQLIPLQRADLGQLAQLERAPEVNPPATDLLAEVTIPIERLNRRFIARALAAAGRLAATERGDIGGMDLIWVQRGELFDQMGLRTGDTIVSVNGKTLRSDDLLADMPDADLMGGSLQLEILRDGTRQMLKVNLDQG